MYLLRQKLVNQFLENIIVISRKYFQKISISSNYLQLIHKIIA